MNDIIQVKDLTKFYGPTLAVDHISFELKEGEIFGFLGPNGAGKTTTIRMMVGLTQPNSGTAWIAGRDILKEPLEVKKTIDLVPENSNLYGELTSLENLIYQAQLYGVPRKERKDRALQLLEEFGLMGAYYLKPPLISWGLMLPIVFVLAFFFRNPMGIKEVVPGLIGLTLLF